MLSSSIQSAIWQIDLNAHEHGDSKSTPPNDFWLKCKDYGLIMFE